MNTLPRYEKAVIPREKFTEYALDHEKPNNKARMFQSALGYNLNNADELINNIYTNLPNFPADVIGDDGHGMRYNVFMDLTGPNGKTATVLTAWIDDKTNGEMRLTTAFPKDRR